MLCGQSIIISIWGLVEGKYRPKELGSPEFETVPEISTMKLMWRMTKTLWGTGKTVIMESGFCVFKWLVGMYKRGVYDSAVVNKCRYWPSGINGNQINAHFEKKEIGEHDCHSGNWKGFDFDVFVVKDPNYSMIMMST